MATKSTHRAKASEDGAVAFERIRSYERVIKSFFRCGFGSLMVYFAFASIEKWAGKTTAMDIAMRVLGDVKFSNVGAMAAGGVGGVYGLRQRALRRQAIERLSLRVRILEQAIDQDRSSSHLAPNGDTNKDDM